MKSVAIFIIIMIIFFAIYFIGLNFSISKMYDYFKIKTSLKPIFISMAILFLVILSNFILERFSNYLTLGLYNFSYTLFGFALMFIFITAVLELLKYILKINLLSKTFGLLIIIITLVLFTYSFVNALSYKEKEIIIENKKILKDTKIIHLSDLHLFSVNSKNRFENVYKKAIKHNPDYIVVTGDFFDKPGKVPLNTLEISKNYQVPIIYAHGNHDLTYGEDKVLEILDKGNVIFLDTNNFKDKERNIEFVGVRYDKKEDFLKEELEKIDVFNDNYNILLYHEPIDIPIASKKGFDLMLSGHTHGGQAFPFNLIVRSIYDYFKGEYQYKDMKIIVSQGTHFWGPKLRLGTRNEIIVINLLKK